MLRESSNPKTTSNLLSETFTNSTSFREKDGCYLFPGESCKLGNPVDLFGENNRSPMFLLYPKTGPREGEITILIIGACVMIFLLSKPKIF